MSSADASVPEQCEKKSSLAGENPLVFLCARCSRPLGDSLTWVASQEDTNCILLRSVSSNVSVDKEQKLLSTCKEEVGWYTSESSEKQIVSEDKELFNLESRVEIEKSIKKIEDVLEALQTKLSEVESKLSFPGLCSWAVPHPCS